MSRMINLNADIGEECGGEECGDDDALLDIVRTASIACGAHAGGHATMDRLARAAAAKGVSIGAHPSFEDRGHFGRREMALPPEEIVSLVAYQVGAMAGIAAGAGTRITHVKAHGALYNMAARDRVTADAVAQAVAAIDPALILIAPAGSEMERAARRLGLVSAREAFPDRGYGDDGQLLPRGSAGAVFQEPDVVAGRALRMVLEGAVDSPAGRRVPIEADTLCIHGDEPGAAAIARAVRRALEDAGVAIVPLTAMALSVRRSS